MRPPRMGVPRLMPATPPTPPTPPPLRTLVPTRTVTTTPSTNWPSWPSWPNWTTRTPIWTTTSSRSPTPAISPTMPGLCTRTRTSMRILGRRPRSPTPIDPPPGRRRSPSTRRPRALRRSSRPPVQRRRPMRGRPSRRTRTSVSSVPRGRSRRHGPARPARPAGRIPPPPRPLPRTICLRWSPSRAVTPTAS